MIQLSIDFYKYGMFKNNTVLDFDSREELISYIHECQEYEDYILHISEECGENCSKWSQKFEFEGVKYNLAADC